MTFGVGLAMGLGPEAARRVYDRIGRMQDTQRFYEDAATSRLTELAEFEQVHSVFELGCGTGRYAARLLRWRLPADVRYLGVEVSPTMVRLARRRLRSWALRACVELLEPPVRSLPGADHAYDRFIATYVFDLLPSDDADALIAEVQRLLAPCGRLCVVSLTDGTTPAGRVVSRSWSAVAGRWPALVGGCRPMQLRDLLPAERWRFEHHEVLTTWGIASAIAVATPPARNA